jgi:guanylate kinase
VLVVAVAAAAVSLLFCHAMHIGEKVFKKHLKNPFVRIFAGGPAVVLLTLLVGTRDYNGGGSQVIERIFEEGKIPLLILDINGVVSLKNSSRGISPFAVYITADAAEIEKRLYERAERDGFSEKAMSTYEQRIKQNAIDQKRFFEVASCFDQTALNSSVSECADAILKEFLAF